MICEICLLALPVHSRRSNPNDARYVDGSTQTDEESVLREVGLIDVDKCRDDVELSIVSLALQVYL